ncbi:unnamed protein product [Mytilus coruscus]|uniref:Uncharacterized protein n=1 Tax=Mytilus coruscus TaxID=42192 RepID=A0A6J8F196_MYTCO|nr:unnamed protein product [Mytilus coruscus]
MTSTSTETGETTSHDINLHEIDLTLDSVYKDYPQHCLPNKLSKPTGAKAKDLEYEEINELLYEQEAHMDFPKLKTILNEVIKANQNNEYVVHEIEDNSINTGIKGVNNELKLSDPDKIIKVNMANGETIQKVSTQETAVKVVYDQDDQDINVHSDKNNNEVTKCDSFCQTDTSNLVLLSDQTNTNNMYIQSINRMEEFFTQALQKISDQQACMLNSKVEAI